jgi:DNA-binding GntR family transcriptional regulator
MEKNKDNYQEFYLLNLSFHYYLTNLCGNERLMNMVRNLKEQLNVHRMGLRGFQNMEQVRCSIADHRELA